MKFFRIALAVMTMSFGLGIVADTAEAARLGGGRSIGAQRPITKQATPPQASQQAAPTAAAPQAPAAGNRWLGPLAGLAAGLGLGWLFANGGFGGGFGAILLALGAAFLVMMLVRTLMRNRLSAAPGGMGAQRTQYAGLGNETVAAPPPSQLPGSDAAWGNARAVPALPAVPPGFDTAGFLKQAKLNFIRLQEANDQGDLDALRDVTTDDLFEKLAADIRDRAGRPQHTDVVTLDAALLEVVTEDNAHWASVRFSGQIREAAGAAPTPFSEVWHLTKPAQEKSGWMVAGIEQMS